MKTSGSHAVHNKIFSSVEEIQEGIDLLGKRLVQVNELKKDGLQFRDALRVTAEFQIRESIRVIFGDHSPEYGEHQDLRIKSNNQADIDETAFLLQSLILHLDRKKAEMLGVKVPEAPPPPPPAPARTLPAVVPQAATPPPPQARPPERQAQAPPRRTTPSANPEPSPIIEKVSQVQSTVQTVITTPPPVAPPARPARESRAASPLAPSVVPTVRVETQPAEGGTGSQVSVTIGTRVHQPAAPEPSRVPPPIPPTPTLPAAAPEPVRAQAGHTPFESIRKICKRFHHAARMLRQRGEERATIEVEDERDTLDLFQTMLCAEFDEILTVQWAPAYMGGKTKTDLLLVREGVIISVKRTRQGVTGKMLAEQISADSAYYTSQADCKALFCFVYDPEGRIGNPKALETELTRQVGTRRVEVLLEPK
jgi:hypothetical protein